ncbi:hypothetical protein D3C71_1823010 [compost metagenome]
MNRPQEVFQLSESHTVVGKDSKDDNVVPINRDATTKAQEAYIPPADKLSKIKAYLQEDGDEE